MWYVFVKRYLYCPLNDLSRIRIVSSLVGLRNLKGLTCGGFTCTGAGLTAGICKMVLFIGI